MRLIPAIVLAIGLTAAGWFVGDGLLEVRQADRYVTVKGLSEREVQADLALWPMQFVVADDDLERAQSRMVEATGKVRAFLERGGFEPGEIELQDLSVTDTRANRYGGPPAPFRYVVSTTVMVRTTQPDRLFAASQRVGELIDAGVVLSSDGPWAGGPTYLFNGLNELKPAMIAEATANAREAAEQFARDSGSKLGPIRRANQGVFVILPRDQAPGVQEQRQRAKVVRVVSTVEYLLED
ncbi:MAG: hypothetical protein AMJ58_09125 [Gammaproteobacteria bacterium SG8_30]|nr:MAG: hypothetical protein AMJ58_09125 [Gammaproteobacteria bacterium SG8_30]